MDLSGEGPVGENETWRRDDASKATHHHVIADVLYPADPGGSTAQRMVNEPWSFPLVDLKECKPLFCRQNMLSLALRSPSIS